MKKILLKLLKFSKWLLIGVLVSFVLLLVGMELFDRYLSSEKGARWLFNDLPGVQAEVKFSASGVRYVEIGKKEKPALLLIHGAPGGLLDWKAFARHEALYAHFRLLIVERPGYGATRPGKVEPSIRRQAERLLEVLEGESRPAWVMGHSYGAPVALIMAALAPNKFARVIGVSGQYDPELEKIFGISHYVRARIFKYLMPRWLWVSNEEKMTHQVAQREVMDLYPQIKVPVLLIHGDADKLVPYENSLFIKKKVNNIQAELLTIPKGNHPLQMSAPDKLVKAVLARSG